MTANDGTPPAPRRLRRFLRRRFARPSQEEIARLEALNTRLHQLLDEAEGRDAAAAAIGLKQVIGLLSWKAHNFTTISVAAFNRSIGGSPLDGDRVLGLRIGRLAIRAGQLAVARAVLRWMDGDEPWPQAHHLAALTFAAAGSRDEARHHAASAIAAYRKRFMDVPTELVALAQGGVAAGATEASNKRGNAGAAADRATLIGVRQMRTALKNACLRVSNTTLLSALHDGEITGAVQDHDRKGAPFVVKRKHLLVWARRRCDADPIR